MNYVTKLVNFGSSKLGINPSTLSGAIDVLIVEQEDGTYLSSPFHVRFGKMGVMRPAEKVVEIAINGEPAPLLMKLGEEGEAFFLEPAGDGEEVPQYLSISPIGQQLLPFAESRPECQTNGDLTADTDLTILNMASHSMSMDNIVSLASSTSSSTDGNRIEWRWGEVPHVSIGPQPEPPAQPLVTPVVPPTSATPVASVSESKVAELPTQPALVAPASVKKSSWWKKWSSPAGNTSAPIAIPVSDKALPPTAVPSSLPNEFEHAKTPVKSGRQQQSVSTSQCDEIYLDDLDDEKAKKFLYNASESHEGRSASVGAEVSGRNRAAESWSEDELGRDSAYCGSSVSSRAASSGSDGSRHGLPADIAFALCDTVLQGVSDTAPPEFASRQLRSFEEFATRAYELIADERLAVRLDGRYYAWRVAAPWILARLAFDSLPQDALERLVGVSQLAESRKFLRWKCSDANDAPQTSGRRHLRTRGSNSSLTRLANPDPYLSDSEVLEINRNSKAYETERNLRADSFHNVHTAQSVSNGLDSGALTTSKSQQFAKQDSAHLSLPSSPSKTQPSASLKPLAQTERYKKTLRLSSAQVAKLKLRRGANKVTYSVTTQFQGTARCTCYAYLWRFDDKIVISDIDGTITRSDALGHVLPRLPLIGNDWAQPGVAQLYNRIAANGYRIMYLSARAIGQSAQTREYLRSVKQGDNALPDGPVFLSPSSLLHAFHREVIERRPEDFKIECLRDIINLFGRNCDPLYAGFGNRVNDVFAYSNVGISRSRIFTINSRSQIVQESLVHRVISGYSKMCELVDHYFPPLAIDDRDDLVRCITFAEAERLDADARVQTNPPPRFELEDDEEVAEVTDSASEDVHIPMEANEPEQSLLVDNATESRRRERRRSRQHQDAALEFNQVVYWRDPLPDIPPTL